MKMKTVQELAEMVGGVVNGDPALEIKGLSSKEMAEPGQVTFFVNYREKMEEGCFASAAIVEMDVTVPEMTVIQVKNPSLAAANIHSFFVKEDFIAEGIHESVVIGEECDISDKVTIRGNAVLGNKVTIGERVTIDGGVVLGDNVTIGDDTHVKANVTILENCRIGERNILHSGTVIGSDGYGYVHDEFGFHHKRPHVGIVVTGDDVEIGANCCVDRATFGETVIGNGTKIDNLVQVAHNVRLGENCLIVAQVGLSGSATLGRNVVMGGQSAATGHIHLGDGAMVAARGGVHTNLKKGARVGGAPAIPIEQFGRASAVFGRLPEMRKEIRSLKKEIEKLKENIEK